MAKGSVNGKDPAVLWYWNDWAGGTVTFSRHQKGCYMDVLCAQFNAGPLSIDEIRIVLGSDFGSAWPAIQKKFIQDEGGRYYNVRLMAELVKRKAFTASRVECLNINNMDMVHIYLLFDPDTGRYKIGSSKYPQLRLKDVQKTIKRAELIWVSADLVVRSVEKDLHEEFSEKRAWYDWFSLTEEDVKTITNRTFETFRTENENEIGDVIEILNEITGSNFKKGAKKNFAPIQARFQEGFTREDFESVIRFKWETWGSDPKMREYLRPETLFGQKFEGYLQGARMTPRSRLDAVLDVNQQQEQELKNKYGR